MAAIKILYCIDCLMRGGTELQLMEMIERLDRTRYEPYLLTIRPTDADLIPRQCEHLAWDVPSLVSVKGIKAINNLRKLLRELEIGIVQTFFQDSTMFAGLAARLAGVPVRLGSCRDMGFWHTPTQGLLMRIVYGHMTGVICNSMAVRDHIVSHYRINSDKAFVMRNGVDCESLPFQAPADAVTDVVIVGNMTRKVKRIDLFIDAAAKVAKECPSIRWHIVGDGYLKNELQAQAEKLGLLENLLFAGRVDNVAAYLESMQIGVICSDSEGLSNALIEYMFKGVAVVATHVGGNPELVNDGETGLLVPPNEADALASALLRMILDTDLRKTVVAHARHHVENHYSWSRCLRGHDELYRALYAANTNS